MLAYLHLDRYRASFRALGYRDKDILLLENFTANDIAAAGVEKRAHKKKLADGIKKLGELLDEGRHPEGMLTFRSMPTH